MPTVGDSGVAQPCPIGSPYSFARILAAFPNAGSQVGALDGIVLKMGSGWSSFDVNADDLNVGITSGGPEVVSNFNFEPVPEPSTVLMMGAGLLGLAARFQRRR